jgi:hypothetical protein
LGSFVHLHIDEQQEVRGIVVLKGKKDALHIEPASLHYDDIELQDGYNHIIYKESDIEYQRGSHSETKYHSPIPMDETLFGKAAHNSATLSSRNLSTIGKAGDIRSRRHSGGSEGARLDDAVFYDDYTDAKKVCAIALWADKEFVDLVGSTSDAIVRILQRWTVAQTVFDETSFQPHVVKIQIKSVVVDESVSFASTAATAIDWLKLFATKGTSRDWHHVCLAHGFTNIDYSGTLGLAYTAPSPENKNRQTGGICQAYYVNPQGNEVYHNTGMSTSENFGSTVGELQLSLVLAHEFGHNFGTGHDEENLKNEPGGNYLMYPMSVSGSNTNNVVFSPMSVDAMTASVGYRGGCFEKDGEGTCGNFITDDSEQCDCGGEDGCNALGDNCCGHDCNLKAGAHCSPLDSVHGMCCDDECGVLSGVDCRIQDTCMEGAECSRTGECPSLSNRATHSLCENGLSICKEGKCSGLCDESGGCTKSICGLWELEESDHVVGKDACKIFCDNNGVGVAPADLGSMSILGFAWDNSSATSADVNIRVKAPGARCLFTAGDDLSGVCDRSGSCVSADTEEDLLGELLGFYNQFVDNFTDWLHKETYHLSNIGWFCVSISVVMISCCVCCYCENHDRARKHHDCLKIQACLCCKSLNRKVEPRRSAGDQWESGNI